MTDPLDERNSNISIGVACDASGFMRRQCPRCSLEFKEEVSADSIQDPLSAFVRRSLDLKETGPDSSEDQASNRSCPYCAHKGTYQDFFTPELTAMVLRIARREIISPLLERAFSGLNGSGGGFLSISVTTPPRGQRPITGPEPDDQVIVCCLACAKRFRVSEGWRGSVNCPYCHVTLFPQ